MSRLLQTTRSTKRCGVCSRGVRDDARRVEGVGDVGPECYRKVAALQAVIKRFGLQQAFTERVAFDFIETTDGEGYPLLVYPASVYGVKRTAERLGLVFTPRRLGASGAHAEYTVRLPHNKDARKRLFGGLEALKAAA